MQSKFKIINIYRVTPAGQTPLQFEFACASMAKNGGGVIAEHLFVAVV